MPRRQPPKGDSGFDKIVLTCEHGGNEIPREFARVFAGNRSVLKTHRGLDIGALAVATSLSQALSTPLFHVTISRLLIDLNRSLHHPKLFSEFTRDLDRDSRAEIIKAYYLPHRHTVERWIEREVKRGNRVMHIGVHSFTPVLNDEVRNADIGILYDPRRRGEKWLASRFAALAKTHSESNHWRVRKNYPYHGAADGFTTALRRKFTATKYFGIELELNQAIVGTSSGRRAMSTLMAAVLDQMAQPG
ncbi:MAG: N-formylglutamate amidohydrolase [Deltaproteobacteria bacterium]|nr:N-formylglutamate amidohydrolase [Deltaproteobacteria bacterium]